MVLELAKSNTKCKPEITGDHEDIGPFDAEKDLVSLFDSLPVSNRSHLSGTTFELDSNNGIADIVFYKLRKNWSTYEKIRNIKPQWAAFLVSLPYRKTFTASEAAALASISEASAIRVLKDFVHNGYCVKSDNGWIKQRQPVPPINKITAIEAKLRNWKKALYQATRYLEFANESWVLLDDYHSKPAIKHLNEFKKRNIGLLTINRQGSIELLFQPTHKKPKSKFRYWYANVKIMKTV